MSVFPTVADEMFNVIANGDGLLLCSAAPSSYAEALSLSLVVKPDPEFSPITDYEIGRTMSILHFFDGIVSGGGVCTYVVIIDSVAEEVLFYQSLKDPLTVVVGQLAYLPEQPLYFGTDQTAETFLEADRPSFTGLTVGASSEGQFSAPWNYDKEWNDARSYPLVVLIPGSGTLGSNLATLFSNIPSQFWTGTYDQSDQWQEYPCFIYISHPDTYYDDTIAGHDAGTIEYIKQNYRVDPTQIHVLGYSMGGSGTHYLANHYADNYGNGKIAALSRLVGYLELSLDDPGVSCWYHIGLNDDPTYIAAVQQAYANFKTARPGGYETTENTTVSGKPTLVKSYVYDGAVNGRYTEYTSTSHGDIVNIVYDDPDVLRWIFSKRCTG